MKIVYVDVVFAVNFCIDYLLLYLVSWFLHIKIKIQRFVLASFFGGLFSVIAALLPICLIFRMVSLLCTSLVICGIAFGKTSPVMYLKIITVFFAFSVLLGGTFFVFVPYFSFTPLMLTLILCVFHFVVKRMIRIVKTDLTSRKVRIQICHGNAKAECVTLCDSGNILCDPYNGLPVILIEAGFKESLFAIDNAEENLCRIKLIPVVTVAGTSVIEAFTPEMVCICYKKEKTVKATVGFFADNVKLPDGCRGIIPSVLVDNL